MKRRRPQPFEQPSLVPMADMLTNTVGVMLFILIFTTLGAGGALIAKRLPREKKTDADSMYVLCVGGRLVKFDFREIAEGFIKPLGKPSYDTARAWARRFSEHRFETEGILASGEAEANFSEGFLQSRVTFDAALSLEPKPGAGEDIHAAVQPDSQYVQWLAGRNPRRYFVYFFVRPDSVALFQKARDVAASRGFGVGWAPLGSDEKMRFSLTGGGRSAVIQ